jgi:putative chitinase
MPRTALSRHRSTSRTGYANHKRFADTLGLQVSAMPALLMQPGPGAEAAAHFWAAAGCNPLADDGDVAGVRRRFNGGVNGLAEVETLYRRGLGALV